MCSGSLALTFSDLVAILRTHTSLPCMLATRVICRQHSFPLQLSDKDPCCVIMHRCQAMSQVSTSLAHASGAIIRALFLLYMLPGLSTCNVHVNQSECCWVWPRWTQGMVAKCQHAQCRRLSQSVSFSAYMWKYLCLAMPSYAVNAGEHPTR